MAQGLDITTVMGEAFQKALLKQNETHISYYTKREAFDKAVRVEELRRSGKWTDLEIEYRKEQSKLVEEYYDSLKQEILSERKTKQKLEEDFRREQRVASLNEIDLHNKLEKEYYDNLEKEVLRERKEATKKSEEQKKIAEDYWKAQRVTSLNAIALEKSYQKYLYKLELKYQKDRENQVKKQLDQQNKYINAAFSGVTKTAKTAFEGLAQIAVLATASKIDALGSPEIAGVLALFSNEIAQSIVGVISLALGQWFQEARFARLLAKANGAPVPPGLLSRAGGTIAGGARGLAGGAMAGARGLATAAIGLGPAIITAIETISAILAPVLAPIIAVALGVAALVGIGYLVYKNWGWITKTLGNMWKWFQNSILNKDTLLNALKMWTPFGIIDALLNGIKILTEPITKLVDYIRRKFFPEDKNKPKPIPGTNIPTEMFGDDSIFGKVKNFFLGGGKSKGNLVDLRETPLVNNLRGKAAATDFKLDTPFIQAGAAASLLAIQDKLGVGTFITGGTNKVPGKAGGHTGYDHGDGSAIDIGQIKGIRIDKNVPMSTYMKNPVIAKFVKDMNAAGWYQPYQGLSKEQGGPDTVHWRYKYPDKAVPQTSKTKASEKAKVQAVKNKRIVKPTTEKTVNPETIYNTQQTKLDPLTGAKELAPVPQTPLKLSSVPNLHDVFYGLNIIDQMNLGIERV